MFRQSKKGLAVPERRPNKTQAVHAAVQRKVHTNKQKGSRSRAATSTPIDPPASLQACTMGRGGQWGAAPTPFPQPVTIPKPPATPYAELTTHPSTHLACSAGAARREGWGCGGGAAATATAIAIATATADLREVGGDGSVGRPRRRGKHLQFKLLVH